MSYKTLLCAFMLCIAVQLSAARETKLYRVHFKVDEHMLDQEDMKTLDELVSTLKRGYYYELTLSAHTDDDAGNAYNMALSSRRANAVSAYLAARGIDKSRIDIGCYGENKPQASNAAEEGKATNRRVDLELNIYHFNDAKDILQAGSGNYRQEFTIDRTKPATLTGNNGLIVSIPADALETEDGKAINAKEVKVVLEEYVNPADFVFKRLSTMCEGKMIETGGMFNITASANGSPLKLKQGKVIDITMPSKNTRNDMQQFTAVVNADGVTEWKTTAKLFRTEPKVRPELPYVVLTNTDYLKSLISAPDYSAYSQLETSYELPLVPVRPRMPRKPLRYKEPTERDIFTLSQRLFLSKAVKERKLGDEKARREKSYHDRMAKYELKMERYRKDLQQYYSDSIAYQTTDLDAFKSWLTAQVEYNQAMVSNIEKMAFNRAMTRTLLLSEQKKLKSSNPMGAFKSWVKTNSNENAILYQCRANIALMNTLLNDDRTFETAYKMKSTVKRVLYFADRNSHKYCGLTYQYAMGYTMNMLANDSILKRTFLIAYMDIADKREALNLLSKNKTEQVYRTTISTMGAFNCDRFSNVPQDQMVSINIMTGSKNEVSFYIPSLNSYVCAYRTDKGFTLRLPKDLKTKMVVIGLNDGNPSLFIEEKTFTGNTSLAPQSGTSVTLKEIRSKLTFL